ncbi:Hypothetical predicted protein [Cloeon dipterum]|uniref:Uncharacterized protein n=1 Tax=Cloeon dipterum TaxID=197152 RepID=A0A8S1CPM7_9INSE|nr:Hypothetical predicted protein [Cloeon dipterum]
MPDSIKDIETYSARLEELRVAYDDFETETRPMYKFIKRTGLAMNQAKAALVEKLREIDSTPWDTVGQAGRMNAAYLEIRLGRVAKMQERVNEIAAKIEVLEAKYIKLRMDLNKSLTAKGFAICDGYVVCFKEGLAKAKFDLSRVELNVAQCMKEENDFPTNCVSLDSIKGYVMVALRNKGMDYELEVIPPEIYPVDSAELPSSGLPPPGDQI